MVTSREYRDRKYLTDPPASIPQTGAPVPQSDRSEMAGRGPLPSLAAMAGLKLNHRCAAGAYGVTASRKDVAKSAPLWPGAPGILAGSPYCHDPHRAERTEIPWQLTRPPGCVWPGIDTQKALHHRVRTDLMPTPYFCRRRSGKPPLSQTDPSSPATSNRSVLA